MSQIFLKLVYHLTQVLAAQVQSVPYRHLVSVAYMLASSIKIVSEILIVKSLGMESRCRRNRLKKRENKVELNVVRRPDSALLPTGVT